MILGFSQKLAAGSLTVLGSGNGGVQNRELGWVNAEQGSKGMGGCVNAEHLFLK